MDAITALQTRQSVSQLDLPGPTPSQLDAIFRAGLRASDHGRLRPWRFIVIEGDARYKLGDLFVRAAQQANPQLADEERKKLQDNPLRAPLIITVVAKIRPNEKIPAIEQHLSAAAAAQLMLLAAHALQLGAVWKTGKMAYDAGVHRGLGLEAGDQIVGFLYLGTPKANKPLPELSTRDFVSYWPV